MTNKFKSNKEFDLQKNESPEAFKKRLTFRENPLILSESLKANLAQLQGDNDNKTAAATVRQY